MDPRASFIQPFGLTVGSWSRLAFSELEVAIISTKNWAVAVGETVWTCPITIAMVGNISAKYSSQYRKWDNRQEPSIPVEVFAILDPPTE